MALGEYKAIAIGIIRPLGVNVHFLKIEIRQKIRNAKRTARMSGCGGVNRRQRAFSDFKRDFLQV